MPLDLTRALIIDEEEDLLAHNRATEGAAKLVLFERLADIAEEIAGVEIVVAQELEEFSVKVICA